VLEGRFSRRCTVRSINTFVIAVLVTGSLMAIPSAILVLADEPSVPLPAEQESVAPSQESGSLAETGEVQERAVIRDHRTQPGTFTPSEGPPPPSITPLKPVMPAPGPVVPNPPSFGVLPGTFALRTALKNTYLTAVDGGGRSNDAVVTVSTAAAHPYARFRLARVQPSYVTFQTAGGYYLSATGGNNGIPDPSTALQANVRTPQTDVALFHINQIPVEGQHTIQVKSGHFLTAVGGGQKTTNAFHTDATKASTWEYFWVVKCGDLGSGYQYAIRVKGDHKPLAAMGGGGLTRGAIVRGFGGFGELARFTLVKQDNGTYALRTPNRINYLTAEGGGGLASGDTLQTNRTKVQAWEQFKFVDRDTCSYTIQTDSGFYLGVGPGGNISTRINDPYAAPSIGYKALFELIMYAW